MGHYYTNGVKSIVYEKADQFSAAGVYVNTGSANETYETHGAAHYLSRFIYKVTFLILNYLNLILIFIFLI